MKLDEIDLKIINILKANARTSISEIAKALNLSRQTVKARIEKLEEEGVIEKYTIKLASSFENLGIPVYLYVNAEDVEKIMEMDEVVEVNRITSRKYLVRVQLSSLGDISRIMDKAEVIEVFPVVDRKIKDVPFKVKVNYRCDYCGKEMFDEPIVYRFQNRVYVFCCKTCLREFKEIQKNHTL